MHSFPSLSRAARAAVWLLLFCAAFATAHAQLTVKLSLKRRMYMLHEPMLATVVIGNNTGHDLMLADTDEGPWFTFQIVSSEGRIVPTRAEHYELDPLQIRAGETATRTVNLNELYQLGDYGNYQVRASIFYPEAGKYFGSKQSQIVLTEGRRIWRETVGVPEGAEGAGETRVFTLLTMEQDKGKMLYVRIEGERDGTVFGCYNLGRLVEGVAPDAKFDSGNNLAVLQLVGQKTYLLSRIGVNGQYLGQNTYATVKTQPYLRRAASGAMQIVGATRQDTVAQNPADPIPKLSERPPGF